TSYNQGGRLKSIGPPVSLRSRGRSGTVAANDKRARRRRQRAAESRGGGTDAMPLFGSHMSIVGGYHAALLTARKYACGTVQLFTKAPNQWAGKPIVPDEAKLFRRTLRETRLRFPLAHDSYLINLASPDEALYR